MKLQRKNKYAGKIAQGIVGIVALSLTASCVAARYNLRDNDITVVEDVPTIVEEVEVSDEPTNDEVINIVRNFEPISESEVEEEISKLNIEKDDYMPSNCYKVIEFGDKDGYYKVMIVNGIVNYKTNENKEVVDTSYTIVDAFSREPLFETVDYTEISPLCEYFDGVKIISVSKLDELGDIALLFGAPTSYIDETLMGSSKDKWYSTSTVADMYVKLVDDNSRVTYEMLENSKSMSK